MTPGEYTVLPQVSFINPKVMPKMICYKEIKIEIFRGIYITQIRKICVDTKEGSGVINQME